MPKQLQTTLLKGILLVTFLFILVFFAKSQTKRITPGDCPITNEAAGPDKTICPYPGSVQIGNSPENNMNYSWTPSSGLSDPFIANPIASPSTTTAYTLTTTGRNIIYNGDFELGQSGFQTNYNYNSGLLFPGDYVIGNNPSQYNSGNAWCNTLNHTPGGQKMMIIDGKFPFQPTQSNFWEQTEILLPNKTYLLSAWFLSTSWQFNSYGYEPIIQIKVNGNIVVDNFRLIYNSCNWVNISVPINIGSATTALIEMRTMTDMTSGGGNDFAVDDISLSCITTDDVIVNVCTPCVTPTINPSGPIDYYYHYEASSGRYTFTTPSNGVLQWYVDGQPVPGATGKTFNCIFNTSPTHNVQVNSNGCFSLSTIINLNSYGNCPQSPFPPPPYGPPKNNHCWPAGITTPLYMCQGESSSLETFDMGPSATYTWDIYSYIPGQIQYITVYSQFERHATVRTATTGLSYANNGIYAKSDLNGHVKVFDHWANIPGLTRNAYQTCSNGVGVVYAGVSGFDNEYYVFPGVITSVSNPAYQSSVGTTTLYCSGILPNYFQVKFSNPTFVNNFTVQYTNNNYSFDCFKETVYMSMLSTPCFAPDKNTEPDITIFPNPATNKITIKSNVNIDNIEISSVLNPILKRIKVNGIKSLIVDVYDLMPGIYNCKITTTKGVENQKLIIKR